MNILDRYHLARELGVNVIAVDWEGRPVGNVFDEDYFLRGVETGKSLYRDYRWLERLTVPMARSIVDFLHVDYRDKLLDFGCARGYVVKALRQLGYDARGVDISEWAIRNGDEETKPYLQYIAECPPLLSQEFDWVIAKDVLEHVLQVNETIGVLMAAARRGLFVVVPLSPEDNTPYVVPAYEKDVTHVHRLTLASWVRAFTRPGWSVEARYRVRGVKGNYYTPEWAMGNGFLTVRRLSEVT